MAQCQFCSHCPHLCCSVPSGSSDRFDNCFFNVTSRHLFSHVVNNVSFVPRCVEKSDLKFPLWMGQFYEMRHRQIKKLLHSLGIYFHCVKRSSRVRRRLVAQADTGQF